jgi:hypothetical protein
MNGGDPVSEAAQAAQNAPAPGCGEVMHITKRPRGRPKGYVCSAETRARTSEAMKAHFALRKQQPAG